MSLSLLVLFAALSPGVLFTIPPLGKKMGGKLITASMHALLFVIVAKLLYVTAEAFQNSSTCNAPPGKYCTFTVTSCPDGTYNPTAGAISVSACATCAAGTITNTSKTACVPCPPGTTSSAGDSICKAAVGSSRTSSPGSILLVPNSTTAVSPSYNSMAAPRGSTYTAPEKSPFCFAPPMFRPAGTVC